MLGLKTINPIPSNSLRPILANFMALFILALPATLTQIETRVLPPLENFRAGDPLETPF